MTIRHVDQRNPINRVSPELLARIVRAQDEFFPTVFANAKAYLSRALSDLGLKVPVPAALADKLASEFADQKGTDLAHQCSQILKAANLPPQAVLHHSRSLTERLQLLRAFSEPDRVVAQITEKVVQIVAGFPKRAADIERGRNPGDVLDPYILSATQTLLFSGSFAAAISATVSHKALMMIEGLLGHLHEDVVGQMRGNVRAPEPRGFDQEEIDLLENPLPGADILQPPHFAGDTLKLHQVKSKTGSAKGGDGKRLGEQLRRLQRYYKADVFYDALIGNTLRGHRSRRGVEMAAPGAIILVGQAAFRALTFSEFGPELLLRLYQVAFAQAADQTGYRVEEMSAAIVKAFEDRAQAYDGDFLQVVLRDSIQGLAEIQDSRLEPRE